MSLAIVFTLVFTLDWHLHMGNYIVLGEALILIFTHQKLSAY